MREKKFFIKLVLFVSNNNTCEKIVNFCNLLDEGNVLVKEFYLSKEKFTWSQSSEVCCQNGFKFASLTRRNETNSVLQLVTQFHKENQKNIGQLIHVNGITNFAGSKKGFHWVTAPWIDLSEEKWENGQPNDRGDVEYCLAIGNSNYKYAAFRFHDVFCGSEYNDIYQTLCEISKNSLFVS